MKHKNQLKKTTSNLEYKVLLRNASLSHLRHGWCTACQGPCDWKYFIRSKYNKRNLGKKPRNKFKPWQKESL